MDEDKKVFVSARDFHLDSFRLARQVWDSGFRPNFLVGLWRGGTPPGIVIQEFFKYKGEEMDHIAIRTERYHGIDKKSDDVKIHGLGYVIDNIHASDRLLIVDDVLDEGVTVEALIAEIKRRARANAPREIKVAVVYYKPGRNKSSVRPDYCIHEDDSWIVFPHELAGLSREEIMDKDPEVAEIVNGD